MNRADVEHALKPIWLGFAAAEARLAELLEQSRTEPVDRRNALDRLQHEADLEQAMDYLRVRSRAFIGDGLYQALDTARGVYTWPNVMPAADAAGKAVADWKASRIAPAANIEPLQVGA